MNYQLNQKALQRLKALVRAGKFIDQPWTFDSADSNALLGKPANWTEYRNWFLGVDETAPKDRKTQCAYPFGKGGMVNLAALRDVVTTAKTDGAADVSNAAAAALADAEGQKQDKAQASRRVSAAHADPADKNRLTIYALPSIKAAAGKGGSKGPPTFTMNAYNGGPMSLDGWTHPVVIDLDGFDTLDKSRPILKDHDQTKVVGHTTDTAVEDGGLQASGVISGHGAHVDEVVGAAGNGFPWQASVGANVQEHEFIPPGHTAEANGQTWEGPVNIARRTSLGEISFVALGADDSTSARIAAKAAGASSMKKFKAWAKAAGFTAEALADEDTMTAAKAAFKAANPDSDPDDESDDDDAGEGEGGEGDEGEGEGEGDDGDDEPEPAKKAKARRSGRTIAASRVAPAIDTQATIRAHRKALAAESGRVAKVQAIAADHPEIAAKAIGGGWSVEKTELHVLRASRPTPHASFSVHAGANALDVPLQAQAIAAAAAMSAGVKAAVALKDLPDRVKELATSNQFRGMGLHKIMAMVAAARGIHCQAGGIDDAFLGKLLRAERNLDIRADGAFSTVSLTGITENILNKALLSGYGDVPSVVDDICYQTDTNDFKTFKRYRLTASGFMQPVGPDGELKNVSLQDESYGNQVSTQGMIITITRQMLINDDMGALTEIPTLIGREAALTREQAVFTTLLTGKSTTAPGASVGKTAKAYNFISTGAANYLTGAGSALGIAGLTGAVQLFDQQVDANNRPILLNPDRLLVPPALKVAAQNLFNGANLIATGIPTSAKNVEPSTNPHQGSYKPIVSPFLASRGGTGLSGASDTGWGLLPNPASGMAPVQIGYLRGQRTPVIERGEPDFNKLGISMRSWYDFGVALHDSRCVVWNDGV